VNLSYPPPKFIILLHKIIRAKFITPYKVHRLATSLPVIIAIKTKLNKQDVPKYYYHIALRLFGGFDRFFYG
jgi:hypothetical protein